MRKLDRDQPAILAQDSGGVQRLVCMQQALYGGDAAGARPSCEVDVQRRAWRNGMQS